jgi:hypothetical protein
VWVVLDAGAAGTAPAGTLTVSVPEAGDVFTVAIEANVVHKPTVGSVLVLDRSGSMAPTYETLRIPLPSPNVAGSSVGTWRAILTIDEPGFERVLAELEERKQLAEIGRLRAHGVPFTLTVQSRTGVRMEVETTQSSRRLGGVARVTAELTPQSRNFRNSRSTNCGSPAPSLPSTAAHRNGSKCSAMT